MSWQHDMSLLPPPQQQPPPPPPLQQQQKQKQIAGRQVVECESQQLQQQVSPQLPSCDKVASGLIH
jgi:hypothetical protein